ncbi:MAG: hypothetical protein WAX77_12285 [Methylococcaceae bacterium]
MNKVHDKSLQLIKELLDSMDDETFLSEYNAVKCGVGPTIDSFLAYHCSFNNFLRTTEITSKSIDKHCKTKECFYKGQNDVYSMNSESHLEQLAA